MTTNTTGRVLAKVDALNKYVPCADTLAFFNNLLEAYQEGQQVRRDLAKIDAMKEVLLTEITRRYDFYHELFDRIFDERKQAIDQHFEIIYRGISCNDKDLVLHALDGLAKIVSSSPFANIEHLSKLLESGRKIEI